MNWLSINEGGCGEKFSGCDRSSPLIASHINYADKYPKISPGEKKYSTEDSDGAMAGGMAY